MLFNIHGNDLPPIRDFPVELLSFWIIVFHICKCNEFGTFFEEKSPQKYTCNILVFNFLKHYFKRLFPPLCKESKTGSFFQISIDILPENQHLKKVLLFGAGKSATALIDYLIEEAAASGWEVRIADANLRLIHEKIAGRPHAIALATDIMDSGKRSDLIAEADIVISLMPPALHLLIARDCLALGKNLLTASYADADMLSLSEEAASKGLLFLCEMGLDPGIDHMSAMELIDRIHSEGGTITSFKSHCGGLVAAESDDNPWHYKISWNPRNVVLAGKQGAVYKSEGQIINEGYESLFDSLRRIPCPESGYPELSFYPNRNSLPYIDMYGLQSANTFIRTTLRHPEFMTGWKNLVDLKLTDETTVYATKGKTLQAFFREHLEKNGFGEWLKVNLSGKLKESKDILDNLIKLIETEKTMEGSGSAAPENFMIVDETGNLKRVETDLLKEDAARVMAMKMHEANLIMEQLLFLGLDDDRTLLERDQSSPADVLQFALEKKLVLDPKDKDLVVMVHEISFNKNGISHQAQSVLTVTGEDHVHTAMAKTVGLPLGIATKLILQGKIPLRGVQIPIRKEIYEPVLAALREKGIFFSESIR